MLTNILQYLEATAVRCPDRVAVAGEQGELTFRQLRQRARAMATGLLARRLGGGPLAILMNRGPEVFPAMLSAVYAGGFYAVLDPEMPLDRLGRILSSLEPGAVLCDEAGAGVLAGLDGELRVLSVRALEETTPNDRALERVQEACTDQDPVYVVFTSGSTGDPKGVVGCHRGVIDYIEGLCQVLPLGENTVFGSQSPLYFDAYLKELIPALKYGARLELIPSRLFLTPVALVDYLNRRRVNTLCWVASALSLVSCLGTLEQAVPQFVRTVAFASEPMPPAQLECWRQALPQAMFYNLYGPTEATGICCCYPVDRHFAPGDRIPIGKPLPNTGLLLLDPEGKPVPEGESGEICVYGSRLTLGYWGSGNGGFVRDPTAAYPRRIYRTGDLGRYNSRGELEFLGRRDSQIKHMGHRIELGEIEARAMSFQGLREAGCVYQEGSIRLYYAGEPEPQVLAAFLRKHLPRYMIPHRIRQLPSLPRRENGKLDRKKLSQCG